MVEYEYKCKKCATVFVVQGWQETAVKCPVCGGDSRRYISDMPPVRYNGTGFASTDIPRKSGLEGYES